MILLLVFPSILYILSLHPSIPVHRVTLHGNPLNHVNVEWNFPSIDIYFLNYQVPRFKNHNPISEIPSLQLSKFPISCRRWKFEAQCSRYVIPRRCGSTSRDDM